MQLHLVQAPARLSDRYSISAADGTENWGFKLTRRVLRPRGSVTVRLIQNKLLKLQKVTMTHDAERYPSSFPQMLKKVFVGCWGWEDYQDSLSVLFLKALILRIIIAGGWT